MKSLKKTIEEKLLETKNQEEKDMLLKIWYNFKKKGL